MDNISQSLMMAASAANTQSSSGHYLAVGSTAFPYLTIYKRDLETGAFNKVPDPATLPSGQVYSVSFTEDASYLAVGFAGITDRLYLYKRVGSEFVLVTGPNITPSSTVNKVVFSNDGSYLAVAQANPSSIESLTIYVRSGDVLTKLTSISPAPTGAAYGATFDASFTYGATYLAFACANSPYLIVYKRSGNTFTKVNDPSPLPTTSVYNCEFARQDDALAINVSSNPRVRMYTRSGDNFTKVTDPSSQPTNSIPCDISFDAGGTKILVSNNSSPYYLAYTRSFSTGAVTNGGAGIVFGAIPSNRIHSIAYSLDGAYVAFGINNSSSNNLLICVIIAVNNYYTQPDPLIMPAGIVNAVSFGIAP